MKAPLSWLREFTPVEAEPAVIARTLSFLGLVVETTEVVGPPRPGIIVARVLSTRPHPAADRIQLVDVDTGDGQALQICCGAFNMKAGDLVPLAALGTVMPSGMEIGRRKMRGEWSNGMLCSAAELGLGPEGHEPGIYVLPAEGLSPGQPVADALGLAGDVVFDIEVSPNRPDCFSIAGIARDLAASLRLPFRLPSPPHLVDDRVPGANVSVSPDAAELCPRFTGTVLSNVATASVGPNIARRLALCGMRSISPIVDVSNYVMLELGQPNHPYDLSQLGGGGLHVRRAGNDEQMVTLDGATRQLGPDDCVIADANGAPVGVGGIMGGQLAEISPETTIVLLEMANFSPSAIAATGKRLGLSSEARTRFERGVDVEIADIAIDRFVELLAGQVERGPTTDVRSGPTEYYRVAVRTVRVNRVLGTSLSTATCAELLAPLGFVAVPVGSVDPGSCAGPDSSAGPENDGTLDVSVPTWRPDCRREVDVIEEVARAHGYDRIEPRLPVRPIAAAGLTPYQKGRRRVREIFAGAGASEAWTSSFLAPADISRTALALENALELANPLDQSQGLLRTSLLPGLLGALRSNRERQAGALSLFEVGTVFRRPEPDGPSTVVPGVVETEQAALVATGEGADAGYAVQAWQVLAAGLRLAGPSLEPVGPFSGGGGTDVASAAVAGAAVAGAVNALHPGRRSFACASGAPVGLVGEVAPAVAGAYGLEGRVAVLVLDLGALLGARGLGWEARAVSRYPASDLDMAFVVGEEVTAGRMEPTLRRAGGDLVEALALFDVWRDASLGDGLRSLAFRARLRAPDRTLTDEEVARVRDEVAAAALASHGAVLRRS